MTIFEDVVSDCLGQHTWNFATGQKELSRLTDVPVDRWDAAYALPTSPPVIQVQTITIDDQPQPYDIYERYIYINAQAEDDVVLNYVFRPETSILASNIYDVGYIQTCICFGFVSDS